MQNKEEKMKKFFWLAIAANILGVAYGVYYYSPKLAVTPVHLWFFVLDSPLPVFFAALSLLMLLKKKQNELLDCLAAAWCLKWGVWSMLVIVSFPETFLAATVAGWYAILFFLHFLEAIEGSVFATKQKFSAAAIGIVLILSLLNDFLDYYSPHKTHANALPPEALSGWLPIATIFLSFACVAAVFLANRSNSKLFAQTFRGKV